MEVATKFRIGKLPGAALLARDFEAIVGAQGFAELAIGDPHAKLAGEMNIAQASLSSRKLPRAQHAPFALRSEKHYA